MSLYLLLHTSLKFWLFWLILGVHLGLWETFSPLCPSLMLRARPFYCPSLSDSLLRFTAGITIQQPISTLRSSQYDKYTKWRQRRVLRKMLFSNSDQTRQRCVTLELSNCKKSRHRYGEQYKLLKSFFNVFSYSYFANENEF